jgi:hypothetical protein
MIFNSFGIIARPIISKDRYFFIVTKWIYNLADKLEKNFKKMIKNYFGNVTSANSITTNSRQAVIKNNTPAPKSQTDLNSQVFYQ